MNKRVHRLRERLAEHNLDAMLVGAPVEDTFRTYGANRRYLSGFTGSMGWLLISPNDAFIAVDFRYYDQATRESPDFTLFKGNGSMERWLPDLLKEARLQGKRVGFEPGGVTFSMFQALQRVRESIPESERPAFEPAPPLVEELRAVKEPEEVAMLQRAVDLGDEAFEAVAARIEPGWTEEQVAWEIEKYAREHGADSLSFETIVASGPWGAMPHAQPRDQRIVAGQPIVIDMGVKIDGYCSDLTRTIILGEPDDQFKKIYEIVLTAQLTAEELITTEMKGEAAHMLAHNVISEAGYGDYFGHGLGHGVGLLVHETPRLARSSQDVLQDGMIITVEPGIYLGDWGGVRIEDMAVIENGRARIMSHAPKLSF